MNKIGRNDVCWCGSGKKYIKCHWLRDKQKPPTFQEIINNYNKTPKYCLHPEASRDNCKGRIIKAHTIQRNGGLNKIATNGHVYYFDNNIMSIVKNNGFAKLKLTGIKEATTFTGFCSLHDNETFKPLEDHEFRNTYEQTFLLAYRAICKEIHAKNFQLSLIPQIRETDKGKSLSEQIITQDFCGLNQKGADKGLEDLMIYKKEYDAKLISNNFDDLHHYIIEIDETPDILCSGAFYPEIDFNGQVLQSTDDFNNLSIKLDLITFSIICTDSGGAIVFSWIGESKINNKLVASINSLPHSEISNKIIEFAFEYFENIAISPSWWDNLNDDTRSKIQEKRKSGLFSYHKPLFTQNRQFDYVTWKISNKILGR